MSSYKLTKTTQVPQSIHDVIQDEKYLDTNAVIGGVVSNTRLSWFACGPYLAIVDTKSGSKVAQWIFGAALKDASTKIVCVQELKSSYQEVSLLVVGLESLLTGGMVCVFDIFAWKVLRAMQFKDKVTSLHVISNGNESTSFPGPISHFDGALAVGTSGGDVFVVDLCRQAIDEGQGAEALDVKNEIDPCQLTVISANMASNDRIERYKEVAARKNNHLAIHINELNEETPHFVLKGPNGEDRIHVNKEEVCVSSLLYAPQLSSLIVGYNFGALQIWNLLNMGLIYTSPVHDENMPIASFAMQEPVDDPRAFCYFWAVYSSMEPYQKTFPIAVLYGLSYESKDWHEGYGYIYQNLQSCAIRFQADLSIMSPKHGHEIPMGAHCLRLHSFTKGASKDVSSTSSLETHESYMLCLMVWNVWCKDRTMLTYLSVFDLNQWYKDQMPTSPQSSNFNTFMTHVCLSDIMIGNSTDKRPVLDALINPTSIVQFMGAQRLEEHYHPNSLAFDCVAISETKLNHIKCYGSQRQLFRDLEAAGPLALMKPTEFYEKSIQLGLTPLFMDAISANSASLIQQRELLLSVALEHRMKNWLCKCATSWGNGSHRAAGLSLELLLNWAWQRTNVLKSNIDRLCVSLFDYSEIKLDFNADLMFRKCRSHIQVIMELYSFVCKKCASFLIHQDVTRKQYECVQRILIFLNVLEWMINVGLLPECPISMYGVEAENNKISVPYPVNILSNIYKERRAALVSKDIEKKIFNGGPILYIDKVIQLSGGNLVENEWKQDGGTGKYPPSSVQGLVRTYLLENVDLQYKHIIVTYFLLDMAMNLDQDRYKSIIPTFMKFPSIFQLSPSVIKVIQAFWLLDHGDLGTAAEQLIDPMIKPSDMSDWHHTFILKNLLLRDHQKLALLYLKVRQLPLSNSHEIAIAISLLISNKMLYEALALSRKHSGQEGTQQLKIIFEECYKQDQLDDLVSITLSRTEEDALLKYLKTVKFNDEEKFKCVYYLQRSRYFNFYNQIDGSRVLGANEDCDFTKDITDVMQDIVPKVTRRVTYTCRKENVNVLQKGSAFTPMSVFLHNKQENSAYKSDFLGACLKKSRAIWLDPYNENSAKTASEVTDDDFPFSRPPHALSYKPKAHIDIIYPNVVKAFTRPREEEEEEINPVPSKRMKLSPRNELHKGVTTPRDDRDKMRELTKIETPVIRRKNSGQKMSANVPSFHVATPQSILKVRKMVSNMNSSDLYRGDSTTPENLDDVVDDDSSNSSKKGSVYTAATRKRGIAPRKSIVRTPIVRFTDVKSLSSTDNSFTNTPINVSDESVLNINPLPDAAVDTSISHIIINSKNSSLSTSNETYYSPEVSLELEDGSGENKKTHLKKRPTDIPFIIIEDDTSSDSNKNDANVLQLRATPSPDLISEEEARERRKSSSASPKSRKSIRESPQRSSPRLRKRALSTEPNDITTSDKPQRSTRLLGRRSLSRQVLENNASKTLTQSLDTAKPDPQSTVVIETITKKHVIKTVSGTTIEQTVDKFESSNVITKSVEAGVENVTTESHQESTKSSRRVTEQEHQDGTLQTSVYNVPVDVGMDVDDSEGDDVENQDLHKDMPTPDTHYTPPSPQPSKIIEAARHITPPKKIEQQTTYIQSSDKPSPDYQKSYKQSPDYQTADKQSPVSLKSDNTTPEKQTSENDADDVMHEELSCSSINANYAIFDPQMNVFQMSHDLTYNDNNSMDGVPKGNSELDVTNYADYQAEQEEFETISKTINPVLRDDMDSRSTSYMSENNSEAGSLNKGGFIEISDEDSSSQKPRDVISLGSSEERSSAEGSDKFSFNDDEEEFSDDQVNMGLTEGAIRADLEESSESVDNAMIIKNSYNIEIPSSEQITPKDLEVETSISVSISSNVDKPSISGIIKEKPVDSSLEVKKRSGTQHSIQQFIPEDLEEGEWADNSNQVKNTLDNDKPSSDKIVPEELENEDSVQVKSNSTPEDLEDEQSVDGSLQNRNSSDIDMPSSEQITPEDLEESSVDSSMHNKNSSDVDRSSSEQISSEDVDGETVESSVQIKNNSDVETSPAELIISEEIVNTGDVGQADDNLELSAEISLKMSESDENDVKDENMETGSMEVSTKIVLEQGIKRENAVMDFLCNTPSDHCDDDSLGYIPDDLVAATPARAIRSAPIKSEKPSSPVKNLRRSLRATSVDSPTRTLRTRRSSLSADLTSVPEKPKSTPKRRSSVQSEEVVEKPKASTKRTRALSVDHESPVASSRRRMRTKSVDTAIAVSEEKVVAKVKGRRLSAVLPIIAEEPKKAKSEIIAAYSSGRRLTRRQAEMLERNLEPSSVGVVVSEIKTNSEDVDEEENGELDIQSMDPIQLLNKDEFRGATDPDEERLLQSSPVSSIASSSAAEVLRSKRAPSSDKSERPAMDSEVKSAKPRKNSKSSTTARQTRSKSLDVIEESESQPVTPKTRKTTRKKSQDSDAEPRRSGRTRTNSEKSVDSDCSDSKSSARGRKKQVALIKSDLSNISEETSQEITEPEKPKRTRRRNI